MQNDKVIMKLNTMNSQESSFYLSLNSLAYFLTLCSPVQLEKVGQMVQIELLNMPSGKLEIFRRAWKNHLSFVPATEQKKPMKHVTKLPSFGEYNDYWALIEENLPNYDSRDDVNESNDLSKAIYDGFNEHTRYLQEKYTSEYHMMAALYSLDLKLYNEAIDGYNEKLKEKSFYASKSFISEPDTSGSNVELKITKLPDLPDEEIAPEQYEINCDQGYWFLAKTKTPGVAISKKYLSNSTLMAWLINGKEYKVVETNRGSDGRLIFEKIVHEKPEGKWAIVQVNGVQCGVVFIDGADCHDALHECISDEVDLDSNGLVDMDFETPVPSDIGSVTLHELTMYHISDIRTPITVTLEQTWLYT